MTKNDLAKLVLTADEYASMDIALPQNFVDDCKNLLDINVRPFYVWCYNNNIGGFPINLTERFYQLYQSAPSLREAAVKLLVDAKDRGECWPDDISEKFRDTRTMYNDYLHLSLAIEQIEQHFEHFKYTLVQ